MAHCVPVAVVGPQILTASSPLSSARADGANNGSEAKAKPAIARKTDVRNFSITVTPPKAPRPWRRD
jgi:hypothetical protein